MFSRQQKEPLVLLGMTIAIAGGTVLCGINPQLIDNITLQSLTSAAFAVFCATLYILYMLISKMVALVLHYIETKMPQHRHTLAASRADDDDGDDDDDIPMLLVTDESHNNDDDHNKKADNNEGGLTREAVIASMYLGGSGSFLAIPPLCMWDISISTSFVLSLLAIAFLDAGKVATEFRANVDTAAAVSNLKRLRLCHQGAILGMLLCILWNDAQDRSFLFLLPSNNTPGIVYEEGGQQWPLVLLAASSPFLLRGGGAGVRTSPAQTLETGLPVCALLAILVLCWYGPLEQVMLTHYFSSPLKTVLPMLILAPPCLATALAFILHSLRCRHAAVPSTLLTIALFVRQQILPVHRMRHRADWFALSSLLNVVGVSVAFWLYRRKVVWTPTPANNNEDDQEAKSIVDLQT